MRFLKADILYDSQLTLRWALPKTSKSSFERTIIAFPNHMRYIIAPSSLALRGLGVGFLYLTQPRTAIAVPTLHKSHED